MKLASAIIAAALLATPSTAQDPNPLCAPMVFSAQFKDITAPTLQLLQSQCQALCESARNAGSNGLGRCAWGGVENIYIQLANLIRSVRCQERCTQQTVYEGDCGCTIDADEVQVAEDVELWEDCEASALVKKVFGRGGWTNIYNHEYPARRCPGGG